MLTDEYNASNALCCCEYYDINNRRNHILACCCICEDFDYCIERLITCKCVPARLATRVVATMFDRLRIPWRGGAKRVLLDAVLPLVLLPLLGWCAAQGVWASVVVFTTLPPALIYAHLICTQCHSQTKFFSIWALTSIGLIVCVFELIVVEMLEIRKDENFSFNLLTIILFVCVFKTKMNAELSHLKNDTKYGQLQSKDFDIMCPLCRKSVPARTFHCQICHSCIIKRDLHCAWLDCCIGETNHHWYILGLLALIAQLVLCSNLILTTACHPFVVWGSIMLPDDCSDVYFDIVYAVCFVTAIYCIMCSVFALLLLIHELWLVSIGVTGHEWRQLNKPWGSFCGLRSDRPFSKGFLGNWTAYVKGLPLSIFVTVLLVCIIIYIHCFVIDVVNEEYSHLMLIERSTTSNVL